MKNLKKKALMAGSYVAVAALAVGGTMAYLTDRASIPNTFTNGNVDIELSEDFEQGAKLIPGVDIEKKPVITNVGDEDAYVWLTFSIPSKFDNFASGTEEGSNKNMIHWNPLGATTEGYVTDARVTKAIADGHLPEGITAEEINASNSTWNVFNSLGVEENVYLETINEIEYNTYVLLYNKAIEPGETTLPSISKVFLDAHIDIAPDGEMYRVENGTAKALDWNIDEDGAPVIYVNAYGIQAEGFADVEAAYAGYVGQWGKLNAENTAVTNANSEDELTGTTGVAVINEDIALTGDNTTVSASMIVNNATISASRTASSAPASAALNIAADTTLAGSGTVVNEIDYCINIGAYDRATDTRLASADVTIEGGTYKGVVSAVNLVDGNLVITGGHFEVTGDATYLINCYDAHYGDGTATVTIKGGTFVNWNPADNASESGGHINFVADGYKVVSETQTNGDIWYTVVAE